MKRRTLIILFKLLTQIPKSIWFLISLGIFLSLILLWYSVLLFFNTLFEKVPAYGGFLQEGFYQNIDTLNPFLAEKISEKTLVNLMYDSLVRPDGKGSYEYEIAKKITKIDNGLGYEIEIKDGYWSDGSKISVDDIIMTFNYIKKYTTGELYEMFKDVNFEKIDNYRIKATLPVKDNYFIQKLSFVKIIPYKLWSKYDPSEWKSKEEELIKVSSGPFIFNKKYTKNSIQIFEFIRNPYYYPAPYLDKVIIFVYPDLNKAYEALKAKEINALGGIRPSYILSISQRYFSLYNLIFPRNIGIFFNSTKFKSFEKINSFKKALDRTNLTKEVFEDFAEPSYGILSPSILERFNLKEEFKKEEISNLNFSDITLIVPDNFFFQKIGDYLVKNYKFKVKLEPTENLINSIIPSKEYDAILFGISYNLLPDFSFLFDKNSNLNLTLTDDVEIQKTIQELKTGDESKFSENLKKLYDKINEKAPIVFIANNFYPYILPKNLKGFNIKYLNNPAERFVKIEEWYLKEKIKW